MDLIKSNINNLTALWKVGGQLAGTYIEMPNHRLSIAGNGEWPNKLWFTKMVDMEELDVIQSKWDLGKISIPIWGDRAIEQERILRKKGFEEKLTQVAMSRSLEEVPDLTGRITIQKVSSDLMAKTWSGLFQEAFGYEISMETVIKTMDIVEYYIGLDKGEPVGTAVLFKDEYANVGIHSMGIIPTQRRKGYAEELLNHLLVKAQKEGAEYITLQASDMGKGLYLKTGFQEDFTIKTFINH